MQLTPRYGERPILSVEVREEGAHPLMRQRRRLESVLRDLSDDEWTHPSRCDTWSVQDVVTHLISTNHFWALSITAGLAGEPTRFLSTFDPVASPAQLVERAQGTPIATTLAEFASANDALSVAADAIDEAGWSMLAEAPPGHLPMRLVADHALWDAWIHERDICLPIGRSPAEEIDEVRCCLRYAVGLGRAFCLSRGDVDARAMVVEVDHPDDRLVVVTDGDAIRVHSGEAPDDAMRLRWDAVALVDLLSMREASAARPAGLDWLTDGVAHVFDQASSE